MKTFLIASCKNNDLYIRDMVAKFYYTTPNKVIIKDSLIYLSGKLTPQENIRIHVKGNRARLEGIQSE